MLLRARRPSSSTSPSPLVPALALPAVVGLAACGGCGGGAPQDASAGVRVTTASVPAATTGLPYEARIVAEGRHPPVALRVVGGRLPTGLSLDGDSGRLAGWPRSPGPHRFTVEALDGVDPRLPRDQTVESTLATFDLPVVRGPLAVVPDPVPPLPYRRSFRHRFEAAGGTPPYRFALGEGDPPSGLTLAVDGTWAGAADGAAGERPVEVVATDAEGAVARATFAIRVVVPPLAFSRAPLPDAALGVPYLHRLLLHPAGGGPPHRFSAVGALPPGLALDEKTGLVQGVPTEAGVFAFAVEGTDAAGQVAHGAASIRVQPGPALVRVDPPRYRRGRPEVALHGSGFRAGMTVRFGGADPVEAAVESDVLARATPPTAPVQSGPVAVALENLDGSATKTADAFRFPLADVSFERLGVFGTARGRSRGLDAGDLDGDGRADLAHAGGTGIEVLRSRDDGGLTRFDLRVVRSDGAFDDLRLADVDADGDLDLVVARSTTTSQSVETYANDGGGRFPATPSQTTPYPKPQNLHNPNTLAVGDLDGDGIPDAALTSTRGNQGAMWLFRGLGDGSFSIVHESTDDLHDGVLGLYAPTGVALADLDGDGRDDVLLTDEIPAACTAGHSCPSTPGPNPRPGAPDAVLWTARSGPDGTPGPWAVTRSGPGSVLDGSNPGLAPVDFDGDGRLDAVVFGGFRDEQGMGLAFLAGDGAGGLAARRVHATAYARRYGARLDADLDACDDVVAVGGDGSLEEGDGNGYSVAEVWLGSADPAGPARGWTSGPEGVPGGSIPGANPGRVAVGDFDGDGLDDFAVLQSFHVKERFENEQGDGSPPGVCVYLNRSR